MKIKAAEKSTRILALIAAVITDRIGSFINFWRENREWLESIKMNENQVMLIFIAVITIALVFVGVSSKFNSSIVDAIAVLFLLVSTAVGAAVVTERRLRKK